MNVPFYGSDLYVVNYNGEPYVPMKPIVDGMGLAWQSQLEKLKQRFKSTVTEIVIVAADGKNREMACLALRKLAGWLATINPNKVKAAIRYKVIQYQEECDDVLYEYWTTGEVKKKKSKPQLPQFRYVVRLEVYDKHLNKTEVFTGGTETPAGIVKGVARKYGYYVDNMVSLPMNAF
ncbi:phage antirepressor N-terminal domain-containing protein [Xenorhabdus sp. DI]|nr:phage antirepressor N-terminal domain-containing protein [Xenorhabdus sp. 3]MBD2788399.1 phage antirepressor N-terminal domain-containing protein [Xenorhabdus sp. DI]